MSKCFSAYFANIKIHKIEPSVGLFIAVYFWKEIFTKCKILNILKHFREIYKLQFTNKGNRLDFQYGLKCVQVHV